MKIDPKEGISLKPFLYFLIFILLILKSPLHSQERFRKSPPNPEPLPKLELPEINQALLSNSLSVSVVRQESLPVIFLRLIILTGESASPDNLPGLATFTANMLSRGTLNLSASDIEERIESIGGNFSTATYPDYSIFSFSFLDDYFDEALEILGEMILRPTFAKGEIASMKTSMFYDLVGKSSDPEFIAKRLLFQILFKDHPYRKIAYSEDVIKNLNRKDLIFFFDKFYRPNNAKLVLIGNLNLSTATRKVSRYLNTWREKEVPYFSFQPPEPQDKLRICFIDLPKAKEATIYMGNSVSPVSDEDFFSFLALNQVIGGTPTSRLFMNLRESKGYAYFAFSAIEFFKNMGLFYTKIRVRPEDTYASIMESLKEIQRITEEKISNSEIEQAKSYLIGNFPLKIKTLDELSLKISEIQAFNLGEEHWNKYYETITLINSEKVYETAQKYPLHSPVVVIVGDKKILTDHLEEFEETEVYDHKGIFQYKISKGELK